MSEVIPYAVHRTEELAAPPTRGEWLLELSSENEALLFPMRMGEQLVVGTSPLADIQVSDRTVSGKHVCLAVSDSGLQIRDLDSTNGTYIGPARVRRAVLTGAQATVVIGRTTLCAQMMRHERAEDPGDVVVPGLVGKSAAMRRLAAQIYRYAELSAPVLLLGESGTGKDVVARALHTIGKRQGDFVALNVGGLSEAMADADLFGHRRGAFTGAVTARTGAFEEAGTGTLFLDEIADLDPAVQVKLLRVIEDRSVRPLGGGATIPVRARIVSACWARLEELVQEGRFREDLFHRISTTTLRIPPLRQRRADIGPLSISWLKRYESELGYKELTPSALARLVEYDWPGNVRELGAVLYRAAAANPAMLIEADQITDALPARSPTRGRRTLSPEAAARCLALHKGNVSAAARATGVARSTFRAWLKEEPEDTEGPNFGAIRSSGY